MSGYNFLSDWVDCSEVVNFLLSEGNNDLIVYYHDVGPVTTLRYKGYQFYLKYNKDYFARLSMNKNIGNDNNSVEILYELGDRISKMIGGPIAYYEMAFVEGGKEKINPTLEWCLDKNLVDECINDIVNDKLFDDGGKCLNVKLLDKRNIDDYNNGMQLSLKR